MKSGTQSNDITPIVACHGLMLVTAIVAVVFAFPWFATRYYGMLGTLPQGFRHISELNHLIRSWAILIILLLPLLALADFALSKKIRELGGQSLLNYWSLLVTSLFCIFMIWFLFALSSPERFIERQKQTPTEPNQAPEQTILVVPPHA
jgi:hypothetical protein